MSSSFWSADSLKRGAQQYCTFRLLVGAASAACVGVVLLLVAVAATRLMTDTSKYVRAADAKVVGGSVETTVAKGARMYVPRLVVQYTVDGKTYTTTTSVVGATVAARSDAEAAIQARTGGPVTLWYDPRDPAASTTAKNARAAVSWTAAACGLVVLAVAAWTYHMRDNPVLCGATVASDILGFLS
jgi:hypothetical protein